MYNVNQPNCVTLVLMQTGASPHDASVTWFTVRPLLSVTYENTNTVILTCLSPKLYQFTFTNDSLIQTTNHSKELGIIFE